MRSAATLHIGFRMAWRHAILVVALLVFFTGTANAGGRVSYGLGLLWKIEYPGVAPSYVFGPLHLPGDRGILRLLQRQGYSIVRAY